MPDRLLSPRLALCPVDAVELAATAASFGFAADPMPEDLTAGWLIRHRRDQQVIGLVAVEGQLSCVVDASRRRRGYAGEALGRLALEGCLPSRLPRPGSAAALGLLENTGYRPDRDPALLADAAVARRARALERAWRSAYRRRVRDHHRRLGIPTDYAARHGLDLVAEATHLRGIGRDRYDREQFLDPDAARAWARLRDAAAAASVELDPVSGFRGVDYQAALIERKLAAGAAIDEVLSVSAAPGFSQHHSGLALDLATPESAPLEAEFENTRAFRWLTRHAGEFGFHLSYPRGNPHGIAYEPWHWAWKPS